MRAGSTAELAGLATSFERIGQRLEREVKNVVAQFPPQDASPELVEALTHLAAKLALDRELPPVERPST